MIQPTNKHCSKKERPFFKAKFHRGELNPLFRSFQWIIWPSGQKACGMCSPFRTTGQDVICRLAPLEQRTISDLKKFFANIWTAMDWSPTARLNILCQHLFLQTRHQLPTLPIPSPPQKTLLDLLVQSKWPEFHQLFLVPESARFFSWYQLNPQLISTKLPTITTPNMAI